MWSLDAGRWLHSSRLGFEPGVMLVRGEQLVTLHHHPRLIDPTTGNVLAEWPDVPSGSWAYCYGVHHVPTPVAALHPDGTPPRAGDTRHDHGDRSTSGGLARRVRLPRSGPLIVEDDQCRGGA